MSCDETICIRENPDGMAENAADIFAAEGKDSVSQRGWFSVALSGGSTPRGMHRRLVKEPWLTRIPWSDTHFFWVDDRCVPTENRASNYGAAQRDFLNQAPVAGKQIYPMVCGTSPSAAAEKYQGSLLDVFEHAEMSVPRFDLIFLGLGADGHTASLFPGQSSPAEQEKWVVAVRGGDPDVDRISMTFTLLNNARHIVFLMSGMAKAQVARTVLTEPGSGLPAQAIKPPNGRLTWLLDRAAASLLRSGLQHGCVHR